MEIKSKINTSGKVRAILKDAKSGLIKHDTGWVNNIITLAGRSAVARRLGNIASLANEGMITYGAVGGGSSTPVITNTVMASEIDRVLLALTSESGGVITLQTYFSTVDGNGDITQFALFGEAATGVINTGTMFEYANFAVGFTKTVAETLTVEVQITVS